MNRINSIISSIDDFDNHNLRVLIRGTEFRFFLEDVDNEKRSIIYDFRFFDNIDLVFGFNMFFQNQYFDGIEINGIRCKKNSIDTFVSKVSVIDGCKRKIWPFHIIRQSEVEKFYEYTSTIVINGIECDRYVDAGVGYYGYHELYPGYIEVEGSKYKEVIATIPQEDLKLITIGDAKDGIFKINIIPKKYIDKIILRRKYLHTDLIEFCLEKFYTGEEDVFELDPKNPDPEVLEMMKKYRVIKELE